MKKILLLALTMLMAVQLFAQKITATGTVKDIEGKVLVGVSVAEDGVTNSTLTDIDGNFQLPLSSKNVIVITMKGYEKKEVVVGPDGKVPDIILQKKIQRVHFGVKGGAQCVFVTDYKIDDLDWKTKPDVGYNGGAYMDLNLSRTFAFEFGLQWYLKKFKLDDISCEVNLNTLHISIVTCKWRPGDRKKQFFILLGHGVEVTLQREVADNYSNFISHDFHDNTANVSYAECFGVGYELRCGLGVMVTGKINLPFDDKMATFGDVGAALTYRFGKR
ncbi:MAG: carboxypeptidase-like regulatory domain-containing protein [Bacteroidales bacterium]|nr:carboxypeptidase-like regulatory domain-containing protein [Bacteroidales bacterium]